MILLYEVQHGDNFYFDIAIHDVINFKKYYKSKHTLIDMAGAAFFSDHWRDIEVLAPDNIEKMLANEKSELELLKIDYYKTSFVRFCTSIATIIHLVASCLCLYAAASHKSLQALLIYIVLQAIGLLLIPVVSKQGKEISAKRHEVVAKEKAVSFLEQAKNTLNLVTAPEKPR